MKRVQAIFSKTKPTTSSKFSDFIRNASSAEKKRVYTDVMKKASERQNAQIKLHQEKLELLVRSATLTGSAPGDLK